MKNQNPVKAKATTINAVRAKEFWAVVTVPKLEEVRSDLRGIMKYQQQVPAARVALEVYDVDDANFSTETYIPKLEGLDLIEYRRRVESVLRAHFAQNSTLQRIRDGKAVRDEDLETLAKLVLEVDDKANVKHLAGHDPATRRSLLTRLPKPRRPRPGRRRASVHGLRAQASQKLSAQQLRFLQVLQNYIAQNGGIELERLYEPPFTTVHAESVDGIFTAPGEVDEILAILERLRTEKPRLAILPREPASVMSTLTTQQKSDIDRLWTEFWTGGITNPLTVIEQISFLMFARLLDVMETTGERKAERTKKPFKGRFTGKNDPRRWKNLRHIEKSEELLRVVRDEVFPHFRKLNGGTTFAEYMQDAQLMVQKPACSCRQWR